MQIIKDTEGREWKIDLNMYTAKALSSWLESLDPPVNLFDASSFLPRIGSIIFAVDCLAVLTYEERQARGVSDEDFGRALRGEVAYNFQRALMKEFTSFFPDPKLRQVLMKSLERLENVSEKEQKIVESVLQQAITEREKMVESLAQEICSTQSQN